MAQTYPPNDRIGFRITLHDNGFVKLKGGAEYLEMLFSGMFGMSGEEIASRVVRVWLLYDTVTDSVLSRLKRFPNLRELWLTDTGNLTLTGWENLSELPNLRCLKLYGLPFTDSYLDQLTILTGLETLVISGTAIGREAVERFKQSLSNVDVDYEARVEAIRLHPQNSTFYLSRARIYRALGDDAMAAKDEEKARELSK